MGSILPIKFGLWYSHETLASGFLMRHKNKLKFIFVSHEKTTQDIIFQSQTSSYTRIRLYYLSLIPVVVHVNGGSRMSRERGRKCRHINGNDHKIFGAIKKKCTSHYAPLDPPCLISLQRHDGVRLDTVSSRHDAHLHINLTFFVSWWCVGHEFSSSEFHKSVQAYLYDRHMRSSIIGDTTQ